MVACQLLWLLLLLADEQPVVPLAQVERGVHGEPPSRAWRAELEICLARAGAKVRAVGVEAVPVPQPSTKKPLALSPLSQCW